MKKVPLYVISIVCLFFLGCQQKSDIDVANMKLEIAQLKTEKAKLELKHIKSQKKVESQEAINNKNSCINNLRQIDSAKEQWALSERKRSGDTVDINGVNKYIVGGMPTCYSGGTYKYNCISEQPECSVHGKLN